MTREIEIAEIELRRLASHVAPHRRAQIVDHHLRGHTQGVEGVDVRGQELLHGLRQRKFDVHLPAVGQHHDEEGEPPARVANGDGAPFPPVGLGEFSGGERERQEGRARARTDGAHIVLDDADAARVTGVAQALEHLLGGERMGVEPADDDTP